MNSFKKQLRILLGLGCLLAGTSATACAAPGAGDFVDLIGVRVTDVKGHHHRIGVSTGKVRAAALVFLDTACPVATRYIPALNELHDDAQARGVSLYGVLSNPDIGWRESADFVDDFGVEFPVIVDSAGDLTLRLGSRVTSESFVISTANQIVYRGRIDDRFAAVGRLRTRITSHDLRDVIENVARGGRTEPYETEAVGCFHYTLGRDRRTRCGNRRGHVGASRRPVAPGQLRRMPPGRRHRAFLARRLRQRQALASDDRLHDRRAAHAAVAGGVRVW